MTIKCRNSLLVVLAAVLLLIALNGMIGRAHAAVWKPVTADLIPSVCHGDFSHASRLWQACNRLRHARYVKCDGNMCWWPDRKPR